MHTLTHTHTHLADFDGPSEAEAAAAAAAAADAELLPALRPEQMPAVTGRWAAASRKFCRNLPAGAGGRVGWMHGRKFARWGLVASCTVYEYSQLTDTSHCKQRTNNSTH